jgi:hypothetical protein
VTTLKISNKLPPTSTGAQHEEVNSMDTALPLIDFVEEGHISAVNMKH